MTDKELRKLNRLELLELLVAQGKDLEESQLALEQQKKQTETLQAQVEGLTAQVEEWKEKAEKPTFTYEGSEPGNLAEAALQVSKVFEAAQEAANQYLDNIKRLNDEQEALAAEKISGIQEEANRLLAETRLRCSALEQVTKEKCQEKLNNAERDAQKYWDEVTVKMEEFYKAHQGLKDLLSLFHSAPAATPTNEEEQNLYEQYLAEYKDDAK